MYPRNAASPPRIAIGAVVQISDGAVQSSGVSVVVRPEGGNETAGGGTISYGGSSNVVYYVPTQAETNYTAFVVTAYKSGCVPVSVTVVTTESTTAGRVYVGTNGDKTGYSISGTKTTLDSLNDLSQTQVSGGAYALNHASFAFNAALDFTTTQKAATLARVTLVDTTTTNTDMRGTDGAITSLSGIATATNVSDAQTAIINQGNSAWITATGFLDAAGTRSAIGLATANLDTQLGDVPTNAELEARTLASADYATATSLDDLPTNAELATALDDLPTAIENADALLGRNVAGGSSAGRTVSQALYVLRNKVSISGGTMTVYDTSDSVSAWTATLTSDAAAEPITAVDPG
jgi:hypothetical protein